MGRLVKAPGNEQGSMYLEAMIGLTVLAMALISIAPLFILAARENAFATDMTVAATLVQGKAEELTAAGYDELAAGDSYSESVAVAQMRYERSVTIEDDVPHPGMKTVTITVTPGRATLGPQTGATVTLYRVP